MIFIATLSNRTRPEVGAVSILFPIPTSEYDFNIALLKQLGIGSPTGQDCQVNKISGSYPILNRLTAQRVNLDELDYLAKRLESFYEDECAKFQAMASKLCLSDIKDLINLTFCCQEATVITDFSDLEQIGKAHSLTINGGAMPKGEYDRLDGQTVALDLIQSGTGTVTPYGVIYGVSNGQQHQGVGPGSSVHPLQGRDGG